MSEADLSKRIFGLDVFRSIAIMFVLVAHGSVLLVPMPVNFQLVILNLFGFLGVELFFVLSGFLIGTIIIRTYNEEEYTFYALRKFWVRRWFRTLPNYYLILAVNLFLGIYLWKGNINWDWTYIVFVQNFTHNHSGFFAEAWSLSVEEWFYVLFPLSIMICHALFGRSIDKKNAMLSTIVVFISAGLLLRIFFAWRFNPLWDGGIRKAVLLRIDSIMFGVLAAYLNFFHTKFCANYSRSLSVLGLVITFSSVVYFLSVGYSNSYVLSATQIQKDFFSKTFLFSLVSFGCACLLPYAAGVKMGRNNFIARTITHISIISYSAYLIHHSIILRIQNHLYNKFFPFDSGAWVLNYLFFWVLIFACSTVLYKVYEKPFMGLRDRLELKYRPLVVTASAEEMSANPDA